LVVDSGPHFHALAPTVDGPFGVKLNSYDDELV
jgi:hypothetical protein